MSTLKKLGYVFLGVFLGTIGSVVLDDTAFANSIRTMSTSRAATALANAESNATIMNIVDQINANSAFAGPNALDKSQARNAGIAAAQAEQAKLNKSNNQGRGNGNQ